MASYLTVRSAPAPRVCARCGRPVFTLGPRIPDDVLAFCSLVCLSRSEGERNG